MERIERYRGALLGLAAGDAVGTTLEFRPPGSFEPIWDMVGGGPFELPAGAWTDDTSMALCLAASLVEKQGFDAADQMERYLKWYRHGYMSSMGECFDIGNTVRVALEQFERTNNPFAGSTDPYGAGNGSLMRLAPVVLAFAADEARAVAVAAESSRTTHGAAAAVDACRLMAVYLCRALDGLPKVEVLEIDSWPHVPLVEEIDAIRLGSYHHRQPPQIRGSGYVVESLEAALWAFYNSDTFKLGCLMAVNLGDDADTTAAVFGQLAGAFYGESAIPEAWRQKLVRTAYIADFADKLYRLSQEITSHE